MAELGRVLVADDEDTFLYSTADLLRQEGYQCDCAFDAAEAAEMMRTSDYDLLIADIKMPGNPKLELIRDMPSIAEGMPVILVTGYPSLNTAIQSIQLPVMAYMVKPIDFDELLEQVNGAIGSFRIYRAISNTRQHLEDWRRDLDGVELLMSKKASDTPFVPVDAFVTLTLNNVVAALSDIRNVTETLAKITSKQNVCQLLNCPRLDKLTSALLETIGVLEKTKSAFKSKDLGELRRKLEELVKSEEREEASEKAKASRPDVDK